MGYLAYKISDESRARLLSDFPPKFADVVCHHVTMIFGISKPDDSTIDTFNAANIPVSVVGYSEDNACEALVVSVGEAGTVREDGKVFHITHSLDKASGITPKYSNVMLERVGWTPLTKPIKISGVFGFFN